MANEKEIKAKVVINSNEAQEELSKLIENFKKSNAALRATTPGSGLAKSMKDLTLSFGDILTKSGSIRKKLPEDFKFVEKRFGDLSRYLVDNIKNTSKKASTEINSITKSISENINKTVKDVGESLDNEVKSGGVGQFLASLKYRTGVFMSYRAISGVANGLNSVAKSTIDLQSRFANIQAITSATDTDMDKLRNTILKVGEASKFSVEDIAEATTQLGQAGLTANEINDVLETTTQLAAATGANLSNTIDLMTSALAVWGLNSEEASHLSDVMVTGMNRTKATLETFRMAVQYAGATMASLNVNFDEFASVAAAAANAGVRASVIGTGLRAMTSELISPTKRMIKGLADLGLTTDDVNIAGKGLVNVLQTLKDAGLNASNAYDLFGKRAAQFVLAAEGQLDVTTQLQVAFAESGATLKAYGIQMDTVSAQWTAMANTIKEAAYEVAGSTHGFIHDVLVSIRELIKFTMEDSIDELNEVTSEFKNNVKSVESYQKVLQSIENRDYKNNDARAIKDTNDLIESVNKLFHKNIDLVKSTEDLAEARKKAADALREEKKAQVELHNSNIQQTRNIIMSSGFSEFMDERGGYSKGAKGLQSRNSFMDEWTTKFRDQVLEYEKLIREDDSNYGKIQSELRDMKNGFEKTFLESAFKSASDLVVRVKDEKIDIDKLNRDSGLYNVYEKLINNINTNLEEILLSDESDIDKITAEKFKDTDYNVSKSIVDAYDLKQEYINSLFSQISESNIDNELKQKLLDKLHSVDSILKNRYSGFLDQLIDLFQTKGDLVKVNAFEELRTKTKNLTVMQQSVEDAKRKKKEDEDFRRRQREADRAAKDAQAREMAGWKAKITAVGYESDIAKAQREGRIQKVGSLWQDETAANLLSESAKTAGFLDSYKEMQKKSQILSDMKAKYGDLLASYKEMSVEEQEQARGDDKRLATMLDLEKEVEKAKYTFGDMGFSEEDLQLLEGKIAEYNEKVAENSKTMWGTMENAAAEYALSLHETVGDMNKVLTNFTKEGLSVFTDNFTNAVTSIAKGTSSIKDAFRNMISDILSSLGTYLIKVGTMAAALAALNAIPGVSAALGIQDALAKTKAVTDAAEYTSIASTAAGLIGNFTNSSDLPKDSKATGGYVSRGVPNRDSVSTKLMPGEYVLKKSAVDALGTNFLNDLNNNAAQTLAGTAASLVSPETDNSGSSEPAVVNVWVVSKEEEAQMGPNDVIATIGKDIMTGGQTRRLIQSVVAGRK